VIELIQSDLSQVFEEQLWWEGSPCGNKLSSSIPV